MSKNVVCPLFLFGHLLALRGLDLYDALAGDHDV